MLFGNYYLDEIKPQQINSQSSFQEKFVSPVPTEENPTFVPKTDPDPIITCNIHANCGGGTRQMKQSECSQMICCSINKKCGGGARFITKAECNNLYCCFLNDGTSKLMTKNECDNYTESYPKIEQSSNNSSSNTFNYDSPETYPACTIFYRTLGYSQTYTHLSPEECVSQQKKMDQSVYTYEPLPTPTYNPAIKEKCIADAERLYNELCEIQKQNQRDIGGIPEQCELLSREYYRSVAECNKY